MKKIVYLLLCGLLLWCGAEAKTAKQEAKRKIMLHAHRGGTGLMPENTIPAMLNGMKCGADYLELDFVFSKDQKIVVSHDTYMNMAFTLKPDGTPITKEEHKQIRLCSMNYDSIAKYDVGSLDYPRFPQQKKMKVSKPLFSDMIDSMERYAVKHKLPKPLYNIEIKNSWKKPKNAKADEYYPTIEEVAHRIVAFTKEKGIDQRCFMQTFEAEMVTVMRKLYPQVVVGFLTSKPNFEADIATIGFVPDYYNVQYKTVDAAMVEKVHKGGGKIVPWTVDQPEDMKAMLELGVDGIITDYPNVGRKVIDEFNAKK